MRHLLQTVDDLEGQLAEARAQHGYHTGVWQAKFAREIAWLTPT